MLSWYFVEILSLLSIVTYLRGSISFAGYFGTTTEEPKLISFLLSLGNSSVDLSFLNEALTDTDGVLRLCLAFIGFGALLTCKVREISIFESSLSLA
jgi:hypothetical protein